MRPSGRGDGLFVTHYDDSHPQRAIEVRDGIDSIHSLFSHPDINRFLNSKKKKANWHAVERVVVLGEALYR